MAFRRGAQMAEKAERDNAPSFGPRATYLQIDPGKSETVRFLWDKDNWLIIGEHPFLETRSPQGAGLPDSVVQKWPKHINTVCRYDEGLVDDDDQPLYSDCFVCDTMKTDKGRPVKPKTNIYSLVAMRDAVLGTKEMAAEGLIKERQIGKTVGFEDRYKEVPKLDDEGKEIEGEKVWMLDIRVASFKWSNFYQAVSVLAEQYDGTVLDRDITLTRKGEKLETRYLPAAMEPFDFFGFDEDNPEEKPRRYTVEDADVLDFYMRDVNFDLMASLLEKATDFHYARFVDTSQPIPLREWEQEEADKGGSEKKNSSSGPPKRGRMVMAPAKDDDEEETADAADAPSGGGEIDEDRMAAMRARVRAGGRRETSDA